MQTDIYYRDITKSDNLEAYLLEKIEGAVEAFFKYDSGAHLTVRVDTDRHRKGNRKPSYICEVVLKPMRTREVIKVSKSDDDFHTAVNKTVAAVKKILRRRSSMKSQHHRRDPMIGFVPALPMEEQSVA
ncbi:Sigma 54 modulation protein / S30EA ribosomal protein [compost metagenome]